MTDPTEAMLWQMAELEHKLEELRKQVDRLDDWSNGLFAALSDLSLYLLKAQPDLAKLLGPVWEKAAHRFFEIENEEQASDLHETAELFEARKKLFRILQLYDVWPPRT